METKTKKYLSVVVVVAAAVFGMVIAGSLGLTPWTGAGTKEAPVAATVSRGAHSGSQITLPSFADIAEEVTPAVVSITATDIVKGSKLRKFHGGQDPFEFFFGPDGPKHNAPGPEDDEEHQQKAGGTGFIIDPEGYILTNNHVVEVAEKIEVKVGEKTTYRAKVVGRDPATDLALIKIEAGRSLPYLHFGDSDKLRVGEWVMAIGDPLNFDKTVTVGVVSAKGRALGFSEESRSFESFIQTDAAINFGNSGGPLINVDGEVIGINTAISRMAQNIGFAVPVNIAKRVIPQLKSKGKVVRGFLGIKIRNVDNDTAKAFGLSAASGAFVESVEPGKPAEKAGIKPGDTITAVDETKVNETRDLIDYVSSKDPGAKIRVTLIREGKEKTLTASLEERKTQGEESDEGDEKKAPAELKDKIGISVQELTAGVRRSYRIDSADVEGIVVTGVKEVSSAADAGLLEGDVIVEMNGHKVGSTDAFQKEMKKSSGSPFVRFYVRRFVPAKASFFAIVKLSEE